VILAAAAVVAGAVAQSATGFGFALIVSPALFAVLDPGEAVTAVAVLGIVLNVLVLADGGRGLVNWRALAPLLVAGIAGLGLGVVALDLLSKAALQFVVGVAVVVAALIQARARDTDAPAPGSPSAPATVAAGLSAGALTTSIGVTGPPVVFWLDARGARPEELRATLAATFLLLNPLAVVAVLAVRGAGDVIDPGQLLPLLAVLVAGYAAGAVAFRRLGTGSFRLAVLVLVVGAGLASAVAGLAGL
jgi:uncharacterized membrane protein YfcA